MKYQIGDTVAFKVPTPTVENVYGPEYDGKYGPYNFCIGTVIAVNEEDNAYRVSALRGNEYVVPEEDVLSRAIMGGNGKWQIP